MDELGVLIDPGTAQATEMRRKAPAFRHRLYGAFDKI